MWNALMGITASFAIAAPAAAQTTFATGTCPGAASVRISGLTPGGQYALVSAPDLGAHPVPAGQPCAGTPTGLSSDVTARRTGNADAFGVVSLSFTLSEAACDQVFQVVDLEACTTSPVAGVETCVELQNCEPLAWADKGHLNGVLCPDNLGDDFTYVCPPGGTAGSVFGTDVYTHDSTICTAAVHAGEITLAGGGLVTLQAIPGQESYLGTLRNGIQSSSWGAWSCSFMFP